MKQGDKCIVIRREPWVIEGVVATVDRHTNAFVFTEEAVFSRRRHDSGMVIPYTDDDMAALQALAVEYKAENDRHHAEVVRLAKCLSALISGS